MENKLKVSELRDLEAQVSKGEITYSRMVEIINEKHFGDSNKIIIQKIKDQFEARKAWELESKNYRHETVSTERAINNVCSAFDMAFRIVEEILNEKTQHYHVAGEISIDDCRVCGLDIRNSIHIKDEKA